LALLRQRRDLGWKIGDERRLDEMLFGDRFEQFGDQLAVVHRFDLLLWRERCSFRAVGFHRTMLAVFEDELHEFRAIVEIAGIDRALRKMRDRFLHREARERTLETDLVLAIR